MSQACGRQDQSTTALSGKLRWGFHIFLSTVVILKATTHHLALATQLKSICIPWLHPTAFIYDDDVVCT